MKIIEIKCTRLILSLLIIQFLIFSCSSNKDDSEANSANNQIENNINIKMLSIPNTCSSLIENMDGYPSDPKEPLGGGEGYSRIINPDDADYIVYDINTVVNNETNEILVYEKNGNYYNADLAYILKNAQDIKIPYDGEKVVYVYDNAVIDISDINIVCEYKEELSNRNFNEIDNYDFPEWFPGDVDGDGKTDLIFKGRIDDKYYIYTFKSDGYKLSKVYRTVTSIANIDSYQFPEWFTGDVDGDGKTDLIFKGRVNNSYYTYTFKSDGDKLV